MHFAQPLWILAGFLTCLALFLLRGLLEKRRSAALRQFAAPRLLPRLTRNVSAGKRRIKLFLLLTGLLLCFVALARPQYGHRWIDVKRKGIDILFALDTSASMLAEDVRPNRLERSKYAVLDFVRRLEGDRVGLLPFAGSAFLMCPLTVDYQAFEQSLQALDSGIVPDPGTNLAAALAAAQEVLGNDANHKLLVIITDGENLEGDAQAAAARASSQGMTIFTVGVGTREGELVPAVEGQPGFLKDEAGQFVVSRLDEATLRNLAQVSGGLYAPLGSRGEGLQTIYAEKLALIPKEDVAERRQKVAIERFPWFLGLALALFVAEYLLSDRKATGAAWAGLRRGIVVFIAMTAFSSGPAKASPGEEAYAAQDFAGAVDYYRAALEKDAGNPVLHYNHGTAAFRNNLHDQAIASFNEALRSDDLGLQEKAYYNRGNAQYRLGEETLPADPQKTRRQWREALVSYGAALQLNPENQEAAFNERVVRERLERLDRQLREQQPAPGDKEPGADTEDDNRQPSEQRAARQDQMPEEQPAGGRAGSKAHPETGQEVLQGGQAEAERKDMAAPHREDAQQAPPGQGGMDRDTALQLLRDMQNEEGMLNFAPREMKEQPATQRRRW